MNLPTRHTANDNAPHSPISSLPQWVLGVVGFPVLALYRLGFYALSRGGTVEIELGPFKFRASGSGKNEAGPERKPIDLPS